jgi:hypothetical protein
MRGDSSQPLYPLVALHFSADFVDWVSRELSNTNIELKDTSFSIPFCKQGKTLTLENANFHLRLGSVAIHSPSLDEGFTAEVNLSELSLSGTPIKGTDKDLGTFCNGLAKTLKSDESGVSIADRPIMLKGNIENGTLAIQNTNLSLPGLDGLSLSELLINYREGKIKIKPLNFGMLLFGLMKPDKDGSDDFGKKIEELLDVKKIFPVLLPLYMSAGNKKPSDHLEIAYSPRFHGVLEKNGGISIVAEGRLQENFFRNNNSFPCPKPPLMRVDSQALLETHGVDAMPAFDDEKMPGMVTAAINGTTVNSGLARFFQDGRLCLNTATKLAELLRGFQPDLPDGIQIAASAYPSISPLIQFSGSADGTPEVTLGTNQLTVEFGLLMEDHYLPMSRLEADLSMHGTLEMNDNNIGFRLLPKDQGGINNLNIRLAKNQPSETDKLADKIGFANTIINNQISPMLVDRFVDLLPRSFSMGGLNFHVEDLRAEKSFLMLSVNIEGLKEYIQLVAHTSNEPVI